MILVTDYYNTMYARGITKQALIAENYLMCNFALQDVGQFIRNLFPRYHQFSLEIDDCSKIIPFCLARKAIRSCLRIRLDHSWRRASSASFHCWTWKHRSSTAT